LLPLGIDWRQNSIVTIFYFRFIEKNQYSRTHIAAHLYGLRRSFVLYILVSKVEKKLLAIALEGIYLWFLDVSSGIEEDTVNQNQKYCSNHCHL
jgi:hypothetical protein